jgi:phosphoglycerate dehydrogenase-like enzyme
MKIAVLDDYLGCASAMADWGSLTDCETVFFDRPIPEGARTETLAPFDILCLMRDRMPVSRDLIAALPNLKFISYTGSSNLVLDGDAAAERGIAISNTHSTTGRSEHAEFIWALLMATVRDIPGNDRGMRAGRWQTGFGQALRGRTLGVLGLSNFGQAVTRTALHFGMTAQAWSQNLTAEKAAEHGAVRVDLDTLLATSDIVTIHLRLSDRTRGLIGATELAKMKPGAILLNTSRGPIVDETALIAALSGGRLRRAGLDVFTHEPLEEDHPLRRLPNVVLSPHMGFITEGMLRDWYEQTVENIAAWRAGHPVRIASPDIVAGRDH